MNSTEYFQAMCRYNRWMNEKLYAVCATIPDEIRKEDQGAFFRSMHGTLNHLLLADRVWLGRFRHQPCHFPSLSHELYSDFEELRRERRRTDTDIEEWVAGLTAEDLSMPLTFTGMTTGIEETLPL